MAGNRYITNNLLDTNSDLLFKGRSVLTTLGFGNVVYVSAVGGEDATGVAGRIDRPFKTIQAGANACIGYFHLIILPGAYTEAVSVANTFQGGVIEYMPGATHTYGVNDDKYTLYVANENVLVKGNDKSKCFIKRTGTSTGGALNFGAYYGNISACKGLNIQSSGTGAALKNFNKIDDCYVYSTGGIAALVSPYQVALCYNSVIISTVSIGVYMWNNIGKFDRCYIKGQTHGAYNESTAGIVARNSSLIGVSGSGYYGNNYNGGSSIDNCYCSGFTWGLQMDTYNYGDPQPHLIKNSIILSTDAAAANSGRTWFLAGMNLLCNKPMVNNLPTLQVNIIVTSDITFNQNIHGIAVAEIYPNI